MSAAQDAYDRLVAARRDVSDAELKAIKADDDRRNKALRMRRKLPKVY